MRRRYLIALICGCSASVLALVASATEPHWLLNTPGSWWEIPSFGHINLSGTQVHLQSQALLLRACEILLDRGFWFLAIPNLIAFGIAKLDELSKKNRALWCMSKSFLTALICVLSVSFLLGMLAGPSDSDVPPYLEFQLMEGFGDFLFLLMLATFSGIAEFFWFIVFVMLLVRTKKGGSWEQIFVSQASHSAKDVPRVVT